MTSYIEEYTKDGLFIRRAKDNSWLVVMKNGSIYLDETTDGIGDIGKKLEKTRGLIKLVERKEYLLTQINTHYIDPWKLFDYDHTINKDFMDAIYDLISLVKENDDRDGDGGDDA